MCLFISIKERMKNERISKKSDAKNPNLNSGFFIERNKNGY